MQNLLKLFQKTFKRVPKIPKNLPNLSQNLRTITDISILDQRARLFYLSKLIMSEVSELQKEVPVAVVNWFCQRYDQVGYQYQSGEFVMRRYGMGGRGGGGVGVEARLASVGIQDFDHPFFRGTLYFHQMKDADKYFHINAPEEYPKYIKDLLKKSEVDSLLDKQNPLGVPIKAQPLTLSLKLSTPTSAHIFTLQSKLGKTTLQKCQHLTPSPSSPSSPSSSPSSPSSSDQRIQFTLNPKLFDTKLQQTILNILKQKTGINQGELVEMSKLMFVGGCVRKIQIMMDLFEIVGADCIGDQNDQNDFGDLGKMGNQGKVRIGE